MTQAALHIIRLEASNIKKIKAVEIVPNGNVVTITGKNDSGKTSTLDAIAYALGGKDFVCERPIREGTSKAHVTCDLGELVVTRKFTAAGGSTLTVTTKEGVPMKSPQTVLDTLCAKIAFDPLEFVRMKPAEQLETLRKLVGLDFTALETQKKNAYDERTVVNRDLARLKINLMGAKYDGSAPETELSVQQLMGELSRVQQRNAENKAVNDHWIEVQNLCANHRETIAKTDDMIAVREKELSELKQARVEMQADLSRAEQQLKVEEEAVAKLVYLDEEPVKAQLMSVEEVNAKVRSNQQHLKIKAEMAKTQSKIDQLSCTIDTCDATKAAMLAAAQFPLDGLSFDESGVLLNGVPFTQGSQARQLQASVAIGMALNPTVKVILVRDASLLDDESLSMIAQLAKDQDYQIWLEVVNSKAPGAIVIEDGGVKE